MTAAGTKNSITDLSRLLSLRAGLASLAIGLISSLVACTSTPPNPNPLAEQPLQTVPVDLPRYMGKWYVIANIPYFAEKDYVGSYAQWALRDDGHIDDAFYGHKGSFAAPQKDYHFVDTVVPGSGNAHWRVRLFWPVYVSQLTLYVDPDYRYTLLGYPNKKLGWIFARQPVISDADYQSLLARFAAMGYDTSQFRRVPQQPSQLGLPGFQSPSAP